MLVARGGGLRDHFSRGSPPPFAYFISDYLMCVYDSPILHAQRCVAVYYSVYDSSYRVERRMYENVQRLTATDVRQDFSKLVNRVVFRNEHFIVRRNKEDVAALISMDEYRRFLEFTQSADSDDEAARVG